MNRLELKIILLAGILSLACSTRVSEWILLNAPADRYLMVCTHKGAIPETVKQSHRELESKSRKANMVFREVRNEEGPSLQYALYYDNRLVAKYDNPESLKGIADSPLRKEIAGELMAGKLCVLLYLTTGNKAKDEAGLEVVRKSIAASPFSSIITLTGLDRDSDTERHFVQMLLHTEDDLKEIREPMLFGIFGRFRVLEPLLAKGITEENIGLLIGFLTADCSCVIKENLPGISILSETSWENPRPALVNRILDENPHLIHQ